MALGQEMRHSVPQRDQKLGIGCPSCKAGNRHGFDSEHHAARLHAGGLLLRKRHRRIALVLPSDAYGGELVPR
jgi:hypothetical protein